jgi:hypothetical protein
MKQAEAAIHLRELLMARGFDIPSRPMSLPDGQRWVVFERKGRQVGVDAATGIWQRSSENEGWHCLAAKHSMSGAVMAVDFLTGD